MSVFAPAYELFGLAYFGPFSDDLYTNSIYAPIGSTSLIVTFISMIVYYYVFSNYGTLYRTKYWLVWLIFIAVINFSVAYYIITQSLFDIYGEIPAEYDPHIYSIALINALWTIIIGFALSIVLKIKSVQASRTPF